jgi:hypothetical protein
LWPAFDTVEGLYREQTPFGPVTTGPAPNTDFTEARDPENLVHKVALISSRSSDYSNVKGRYSRYGDLAPMLDREMAGLVLMEVYDTLGRFWDPDSPETELDRQQRSRTAQTGYVAGGFTAKERRVMAVFYALALFSEDQRNAGGKGMRAALWRVFSGDRTAEQSFAGDEPDFPQARAGKLLTGFGEAKIGGRQYDRLIQGGYVAATPPQRKISDFVSEASDDEGETARHRKGLAPKLRDLLRPYLEAKSDEASVRAVRREIAKRNLRRGQSIRAREKTKTGSAGSALRGQKKTKKVRTRAPAQPKQGMKRARSGADDVEQRPAKRTRSQSWASRK